MKTILQTIVLILLFQSSTTAQEEYSDEKYYAKELCNVTTTLETDFSKLEGEYSRRYAEFVIPNNAEQVFIKVEIIRDNESSGKSLLACLMSLLITKNWRSFLSCGRAYSNLKSGKIDVFIYDDKDCMLNYVNHKNLCSSLYRSRYTTGGALKMGISTAGKYYLCIGNPEWVKANKVHIEVVALIQKKIPSMAQSLLAAKLIEVKNSCDFPITLALRYKNKFGYWENASWYTFDANENASLLRSSKDLYISSDFIYFYAEGAQNSVHWSGGNKVNVKESIYYMRQMNLPLVDNKYYLELTYDND